MIHMIHYDIFLHIHNILYSTQSPSLVPLILLLLTSLPPRSVSVHVLGVVGGGVCPNEFLQVVNRNTVIACLRECRHLTNDLPVENFFPSPLAIYKSPWKSCSMRSNFKTEGREFQ